MLFSLFQLFPLLQIVFLPIHFSNKDIEFSRFFFNYLQKIDLIHNYFINDYELSQYVLRFYFVFSICCINVVRISFSCFTSIATLHLDVIFYNTFEFTICDLKHLKIYNFFYDFCIFNSIDCKTFFTQVFYRSSQMIHFSIVYYNKSVMEFVCFRNFKNRIFFIEFFNI